MLRKSVSILITEKDEEFIKEFITNNPIINSYPKFISYAINQYIKNLKSKEDENHKDY